MQSVRVYFPQPFFASGKPLVKSAKATRPNGGALLFVRYRKISGRHRTDVREEMKRLTDGEGLDLAAELSGVNSALDQAESCLGRHGRAVIIGMSGRFAKEVESRFKGVGFPHFSSDRKKTSQFATDLPNAV